MPFFKTKPLNLNSDFRESIDAVRNQINDVRLKNNPDQIVVPVILSDQGTIYLVLNNRPNENGNAYPDNLYIEQILDHDEKVLYDKTKYGYVSYSKLENLPTVNFFSLNYQEICKQLVTNQYKKMVLHFAMLVEAIRLYDVGDAVESALFADGTVNFDIYREQITSWVASGQAYNQYVQEILELSNQEAEQQDLFNLQFGIEESLNVQASSDSEDQFYSVATLDTAALLFLAGLTLEFSKSSH